jgi:hypothetical protein
LLEQFDREVPIFTGNARQFQRPQQAEAAPTDLSTGTARGESPACSCSSPAITVLPNAR